MATPRALIFPALLLTLAACGEPPAEAPAAEAPAAEAPAADPHAGHDMPAEGEVPAVEAPPEGAKVMFVEPAEGATVASPVKIVMGAEGITVQKAGELAYGTGHHHLIVDGQGIAAGEVVPKDETHIHFGDGSTETTVELAPGAHTLTLQFADGLHRSYGPAMSATINVTVQ